MSFKIRLSIGLVVCSMCLFTTVSCSSDDILSNQEQQEKKVAPLTITVDKNSTENESGKSSRIIIQDGETGLGTAIKDLVWESGDILWAYSPSFNAGKGGYTKLVLASTPGSNVATFKTEGDNNYDPNKPLLIYYHGGAQSSTNGTDVLNEIGNAGEGNFAYFKRSDESKSSEAIFGHDKNTALSSNIKTVQADPFFMRSCYIAEAPEDGKISCTLDGHMPLLSFRLKEITGGLLNIVGNLIGNLRYDVTVACDKGDSSEKGFPEKVTMSLGSDGKLSQDVVTWGSPLTFSIGNGGLTNWTTTQLWASGGIVYVSLPAIDYKNLQVQVEIVDVDTNQGLLKYLLPGLKVGERYYVCSFPKDFPVDVNNGAGNNASSNLYPTGDVYSFSVLGLGSVSKGNWKLTNASILGIGKNEYLQRSPVKFLNK